MKQGNLSMIRTAQLVARLPLFLLLLAAAWLVLVFAHEYGHFVGNNLFGGSLKSVEMVAWYLPRIAFLWDPFPLVTLWGGPVIGVLAPISIAIIIDRHWMWFISNFCLLGNGVYIATAWLLGSKELDTPKMLEAGTSPLALASYCLLTIGLGFVGFCRSCKSILTSRTITQIFFEPSNNLLFWCFERMSDKIWPLQSKPPVELFKDPVFGECYYRSGSWWQKDRATQNGKSIHVMGSGYRPSLEQVSHWEYIKSHLKELTELAAKHVPPPDLEEFQPKIYRIEEACLSSVQFQGDGRVVFFLDLEIISPDGYELSPFLVFDNWQVVHAKWSV